MPTKADKRKKKRLKERLRERQVKYQKALEAHRIRLEKEIKRRSKRWTRGKVLLALSAVILVLLGMYIALYYTPPSTQPQQETSQSQPQQQPLSANVIYIWPDGRVEPESAPIVNMSANYYIFTDDVQLPIIVLKDNIVIDGASHVLKGSRETGSKGLDLTGRKNVTIMNLKIQGFDYGIYLNMASGNTLIQNELTDNYCGIWIIVSSGNNITSNKIVKNEFYAISFRNSTGNVISKNEIRAHNNYTLYFGYSAGNIIHSNNITDNRLGVFLYASSNNTMFYNVITKNYEGVHLFNSKQNLIKMNKLLNNTLGLVLSASSLDNIIYGNNFIKNAVHAEAENATNIWDNGYSEGGNYWDDYKDKYPDAQELGGSGIWNAPYIINENNQDRYPKVNPISIPYP